MADSFYHPIPWTRSKGPDPIGNVIGWYANLWAALNLGVA